MTSPQSITTCPDADLCAVFSKRSGEDPIGSAPECDRYLIIEVPMPWGRNVLHSPNFPAELLPVLEQAAARSAKGRCLAIAPDRRYSQLGYRRILYFQRPAEKFSAYEKQEFWVPENRMVSLVQALSGAADLAQFEPYRRPANTRDFLVCAHAELDICCGRFSRPVYDALKTHAKPDAVRIWRTSHIGNHRLAPTLIEFPEGRYWGHLEPETPHHLVRRDVPAATLRDYYRGWAGLPPLAQIVEGEIFAKLGWAWCAYRQSGQVLSVDDATGQAQVQIDFISPEGETGSYRATVAVSGRVTTLNNSGKGDFREVNQYRVNQLERL